LLCNSLQSPTPTVFLSTTLSNILSPRSSLKVRDQVSHSYERPN
jgi:hypothetical protein